MDQACLSSPHCGRAFGTSSGMPASVRRRGLKKFPENEGSRGKSLKNRIDFIFRPALSLRTFERQRLLQLSLRLLRPVFPRSERRIPRRPYRLRQRILQIPPSHHLRPIRPACRPHLVLRRQLRSRLLLLFRPGTVCILPCRRFQSLWL